MDSWCCMSSCMQNRATVTISHVCSQQDLPVLIDEVIMNIFLRSILTEVLLPCFVFVKILYRCEALVGAMGIF